jgi:hypothetical protein
MRKRLSTMLCLLSLIAPAGLFAGTNGWSYTSYSNGSYVPLRGTFGEFWSTTYQDYTSYVDFTFDATNVSSILDYNNGGNNPGTNCDNAQAYVTVDMTAVPISDLELEGLDAYSHASNLPNPKFDLEDDFGTGPHNEESEVVALGTVQAGVGYYFDTYWYDYRTGQAGYNGNIQVQFAMSSSGWLDYNNCVTSAEVQVINPYSQYKGSL